MNISDVTISRRIQRRLRKQGIYIHNMVVRIIVAHTIDQFVGMPRTIVKIFLDHWRRQVSREFWVGRLEVLRGAYSKRHLSLRALNSVAAHKRVSTLARLTADERGAMMAALIAAQVTKNQYLIDGLRKALDTMPTMTTTNKNDGLVLRTSPSPLKSTSSQAQSVPTSSQTGAIK